MNEKFFNVMKSAVEAYFDTLVECGGEYREIYDKQSDFAKTIFFGKIASIMEKKDFAELLEMADKIEQDYLKNHTETN